MNSADLLQRRLEQLGNASSRARKRSECSHGWAQTRNENNADAAKMAGLRIGETICLHCGAVFPSFESLHAAGKDVLERYL